MPTWSGRRAMAPSPMPAAKRKWSVMRTSRQTIRAVIAGLALSLSALCAAAIAGNYRSPQDALEQGIGAFNGGYYEIAIPALEYAADAKLFLAPYYLARIYSDN